MTVVWSNYVDLNQLSNPIWPTIIRDVFIFKKSLKSKIMNNSSISQIPQCIRQITHNAPFSNTFLLQNGALWDKGLVHRGICAMGLLIRGPMSMSSYRSYRCLVVQDFQTDYIQLKCDQPDVYARVKVIKHSMSIKTQYCMQITVTVLILPFLKRCSWNDDQL